ncbi:probable serine/threonine-protein kinase At1g09600 [Tripterygium wilfordii]|uniref:probable serine/threonine-protein kinase At1g09600 n=1 Tax=Tripterygium wilfordii TaxID=458696 RepID=UPI0018F7E54D|nr:probable serine/threonine-protein kinase At1g09600 [Tripterygium wilfordii]
MGCICSKGAAEDDVVDENERGKELSKSSVQLIAPASSKREDEFVVNVSGSKHGSVRPVVKANEGSVHAPLEGGEEKTQIVDRPTKGHPQRRATMDLEESGERAHMTRLVSMPHGAEGEQIVAGWPSWLTSVAGEAIKGWVPRRANSFEKLEKIGQGTYSSVYKARDLETGKIVAMKKVRFVNMDPESVRFMAREIYILRKLDHPNVMKLEGLVTSRLSGSLHLVFDYMEHDLSGLAATRGIKFTEAQIKCYMQQLLCGLEHCHSRGVLHRDIKGSNLLVNDNGVLKIGDFGLATCYQPDQNQPLTSRVVTLWYRPPELLLGATDYGPAVDLWSTGCILAELFAGKPIMPGRTEVEQMHKIFKLCGSPSEEYWQKTKLPHATSFKPQQPYKRCVAETFKKFPPSALALVDKLLAMEPENRGTIASALGSEFFRTQPLPCDPSSLPKYPPSKELDLKLRDEEAKRRKAETVKGRGPESVRRGSRDIKGVPTPEFIAQGQPKTTSSSHKYDLQQDSGSGFRIEPPRGSLQNGYSHSNSMIHPSVVGSSWNKSVGSGRSNAELKAHRYQMPQAAVDLSASSLNKDDRLFVKDSTGGYAPKKNRIHYSGPLMPPGGNIEDLLKEHERQIQHAVRKARLEKSGTKNNFDRVYVLPHNRGKYEQ